MAVSTNIIRPNKGFQEKFVRSNIDVVIGGGVLAPQPIDSLIATPNGFVKMGDVKVGDIICDHKGGTQSINYVIDRGLLPCVEFTLSDGRKVQSALEHEWLVKSPKHILKRRKAQDIIQYMDSQEGKDKKHIDRFRISLPEPIFINKEEELKIDPYLLGCLLGDGWFSENKFYMGFSTTDKEMVDNILDLGYNIKKEKKDDKDIHYEIRNKELKQYIRELGLLGKHAKDKFIPKCYKNSSVKDRISLLQGLFDTDGHCSITKNGGARCAYTTISPHLAKDIQDIVWSLGGKCRIHTTSGHKGCIDGREFINVQDSYRVHVWLEDDKNLFRLTRKRDNALSVKKNSHALSIREYKLIGNKHCKCINVSGEDHLYLTDNYVITCNCGKTSGAVLSCAEPSEDSRWRGVFLRNNLGDLKSGGGILDEFKNIYGNGVSVIESGDPHVDFPSGARVDVTHIADQSRDKVRQRFKGRQYDYIYFDEMTGFSWDCFVEVSTRNRGKGKWTGKIRGTTNPDRNHWLRIFLDWYIGVDGFIREDREGRVRYFFINGETVKDVVWGDTKEEVYKQCKIAIDKKLSKVNTPNSKVTVTYEDMIRSFTFYLGKMTENTAILGDNSGYVGAVAMSGGRSAEQLLEGNWNVSPDDDAYASISSSEANQVFMNDPMRNEDKWITCDLADVGTDNFVAIAWNGFHIEDILIVNKSEPRDNAEYMMSFAKEHGIPDNRIIYDGVRARYINDYIPDSEPFISNSQTRGIYGRMFRYLKDECFGRLVEVIKRGNLSIEENIANRIYKHQRLKVQSTIQNEFIEECLVVSFKEGFGGKKALLSKKEMNSKLGKERSMDLLDAIAMRMLPVLDYAYGEELIKSMPEVGYDDDEDDDYFGRESIYETSSWY